MPGYGDLVILISPRGKRYLRRIQEGQGIHFQEGILSATTVREAIFGGSARTAHGVPFMVQRPELVDLLMGVKRQTQIIYPKDIAYICMKLGVGPGRVTLESGTGSGSLTLALSYVSGPTGHVHSCEAREEFHKLARRNLEWAGLGENVTLYLRDIATGFPVREADAVFLDVRTPWEYLDQALAAVKPGGTFGFLVPTVDQVGRVLFGLETRPFGDIEVVEILLRKWKPVADRLRPEDRMIAHTGFLIFARQQEKPADWDSFITLGTRERKQYAARRQRLGETGEEEI